MSVRVQSVADASDGQWLPLAEACPCATYFHTPYWYDLIVPGQRRGLLEVKFDDGASALIPIANVKRFGGLLTDRFSSPGGTYGGWISRSALGEEHGRALFGILASKKNLTFRVNPFDGSMSKLDTGGFIEDFTHTLDLTLGERELYNGLSAGHRRGIKYAAGSGVTVKAARSWYEWERYYGLYRSSLERWRAGKLRTETVYPPKFFRRLYENSSGHEILWLAYKGGEPLCGALCFYWNRHAVYWHGAASARYFHLKPNNLLFWEIILDAMRKGYAVFDFNPSGGYAGVESFKERFGARRVATPVITTRSPLRRIVAGLRGGSARGRAGRRCRPA